MRTLLRSKTKALNNARFLQEEVKNEHPPKVSGVVREQFMDMDEARATRTLVRLLPAAGGGGGEGGVAQRVGRGSER